ncbi:MAG: 2Fe-2S iron-sulfur cluster-binding protein [Bacteroidota bacterium]
MVKELQHLTEDTVAITFDVPKQLQKDFQFIQGQHLTLRATIDGDDTRRSYSICSCPLNNELTVAIKKLQGGKFSTYANEKLVEGDFIDVLPPNGKFYVPLDPSTERLYVAFASGSGITPIISIIETTLRVEPMSNFILFFGNRRTSSIIFHERLEALKNQFMGRFSLFHVLSKERQESVLFSGRIDREKLRRYSGQFFDPASVDHYFTCGPEEMMLSVKEQLKDFNVADDKIHLELFTSPTAKLGERQTEATHSKYQSEITITLDGSSVTFPYNSESSILDEAYEHGLELPYACKAGVCSTCVGKVESGEVDMDVNYALEPDELARGLVLSCRARPKTEKVTLNFDV